jgi:hypothetical protein
MDPVPRTPAVAPEAATAGVADRLRTPALVVMAILVAIGLARQWSLPDEPARGLDTTCRHFLEMSRSQQASVMAEAGVVPGLVDARARYFRDGCITHPGSLDHAISGFW